MASSTFRCKLITPESELLNEDATSANIPAWDGALGLLPGAAPVTFKLGTGELAINFPDTTDGRGGDRSYFVQDGFAKMAANELTILATRAIPAENLNETEAQAELKEAEARVVPADATDRASEMERITADRNAARAKLRLAQQAKAKGI